LSTTRHCCNLDVWALAQSRGDGHCSLVTPKRVLSEYNEDLIFFFFLKKKGKIISAKTFCLESTLYIWKYFILNIRADSSHPPICFAFLRPCPLL